MKKKRRRKRIRPKGMKVKRDHNLRKVSGSFNPIETLQIVEWCPDDKAEMPPEAVWVILTDILDDRHVLRFTGPDTLGWFIEELIAYRKRVWKDAEPINHEVTVDDVAFQLRKMDEIPLLLQDVAIDGHYVCHQCNSIAFKMTNGDINVIHIGEEKLAEAVNEFPMGDLPSKVCPGCEGVDNEEQT